jgi:hypothetical protein
MTKTTGGEVACYDGFAAKQWALNSAVECHLHTVEVIGSNPIAPTSYQLGVTEVVGRIFSFCLLSVVERVICSLGQSNSGRNFHSMAGFI